MKKIYIFGVGKGKRAVIENLIESNIEMLGYIDNNAEIYADGMDGKEVFLPEEIDMDFDYIIVSVMRYRYIDEQLFSMGIPKDQVIHFFSFDDALKEEYWYVLRKNTWRLEAMLFEFEKKVRAYSRNVFYETADIRRTTEYVYPKIMSAEDAVELIYREHKSLARFGDGEFELMQMKKRAGFQCVNKELADRLRNIIRSENEHILIAVADIYGSLERYTLETAEDIRVYLSPQIRREHMEMLDLGKTYYDAFLSRPYIMYRDKKKAGKRFEALKRIWEDRDIVLVEGIHTRMGVGNSLFDKARSVKRILAPSENAYERYQEILSSVKRNVKNELVLIALGPTATVLAYDLMLCGFWAIDIGHLDLEYEWYCMEAKETCNVSHKYVNEVNGGNHVSDLPPALREEYEREVMCRII